MTLRLIIILILLLSRPAISHELTPSQQALYQANGYLIINSLFSESEILQISRQAERATRHAQALIRQNSHNSEQQQSKEIKIMDHGTQFIFDAATNSIKRLVWVGASYPELLEVGKDLRLTEPVTQLIQINSVDHLINQLHPKLPGDKVEFIYHRDIESRRSYDPDCPVKTCQTEDLCKH